MEAIAEKPRRKGRPRRPQALSNAEIWAEVLKHPDVMKWASRWCGGDEGTAWLAMFNVGCMWKPDGGASMRTYLRAWAKHEARTIHGGGKVNRRGGGLAASYAILTHSQRVFGKRSHDGEDVLLQDILPAEQRESEWGHDEIEALRAALQQLRENERAVIRGHFFERRTLQSIAIERGVSLERVRQIEQRGLARARRLLERRRVG